MSRYQQLTEGGYDLSECISALQKEIRRGKEKEALYWALEINSRYPYYLWRRLVIIATEDIGLANLLLVNTITNLKSVVDEAIKRNQQNAKSRGETPGFPQYDLAVLGFAILAMARSPKSREGDDFCNVVMREMRTGEMKLEVPDYALDQHTSRGRAMGRGPRTFWEVGAHLENKIPSEYESQAWVEGVGDGYYDGNGRKVSLWPPAQSALFDSLQPRQGSFYNDLTDG